MSETTQSRPATPAVADPAPLGLAAFAMTTFVLSVFNAKLIKESGDVVLPLALFYGGLSQFLAGMWEFRRGNTFGALAFSSFGAFWLAFWGISKWGTGPGDTHQALGIFLVGWAIFTAYMAVAATKTTHATLLVLVLLTVTFVFLAAGAFQNGTPAPDSMTQVGGWFGLATAAAAWYTSFAGVLASTHGREIMPTNLRR
jgi:succinate-acetate transporter protein